VAVALPPLAEAEHLLQRPDSAHVGVDRKAGAFQVLEDLGMALEPSAFHRADAMAPQAERPRGGDAPVLLAQAPGRSIARVGEGRLAPVPKFLVQLLEGPDGEVDLAPYLQEIGVPGSPQSHRDGADGPDVRRDVVAHGPVPAGRPSTIASVLVRKRHGQTVDLQLADELGLPPHRSLDPLAPRVELLP